MQFNSIASLLAISCRDDSKKEEVKGIMYDNICIVRFSLSYVLMVWNFLALTNLFGWRAWHDNAWNGMNTWHNHARHCMTKDNPFDLFALINLHSIFTNVYINEKNLEMSLKDPKKIILCKSVIIADAIWDWKHTSWW